MYNINRKINKCLMKTNESKNMTPTNPRELSANFHLNDLKLAENSIFKKEYCNEFINNNIWWIPCKVNSEEIKIYDNILSDEEKDEIFSICKNAKWTYGQSSIKSACSNKYSKLSNKYIDQWPKNISFLFFKFDVKFYDYFYKLFYQVILPKLETVQNKHHIVVDRLYFNTHTPGCCGVWHKDGKSIIHQDKKLNAPTVLLYFNKDWNINYDGSTSILLEDGNGTSNYHVNMKHGRILVFPSYISHKMSDVSYYTLKSNVIRYVVAYHLRYDIYSNSNFM